MSTPPTDDAAAVGSLEAGDEVEERGLAGAVVADEADDASGWDVQVDVVDGDDPSEPLD